MGFKSGQTRVRLGLETSSSKASVFQTEGRPHNSRIFGETLNIQCSRGSFSNPLSGTSFPCSKERLSRETDNSRYFVSKCTHCDPPFKMVTLDIVAQSLPHNAFTCSIDLKDAFWHVPVAKFFRPFLGFRYQKRTFQFKALPFGLSVAPRVFTKVLAPVIAFIREQKVSILPYLDDLLI